METKFQTSFIPKAPVTDSSVGKRSPAFGFIFLISLVLFLASIGAAGIAYFYGQILDQKIKSGNDQLNQSQNIFDPKLVQDYSRLNDRINSAYEILKKHVAVSPFFDVLSDVTLQTVEFRNFTYANAGGEKITINMNGKGPHYQSVILQAQALTDPKAKYPNAFKSPIFGDVTADALENVSFSLSTAIDPLIMSYYKLVQDLKKSGQLDAYATIGTKMQAPVPTLGPSTNPLLNNQPPK